METLNNFVLVCGVSQMYEVNYSTQFQICHTEQFYSYVSVHMDILFNNHFLNIQQWQVNIFFKFNYTVTIKTYLQSVSFCVPYGFILLALIISFYIFSCQLMFKYVF